MKRYFLRFCERDAGVLPIFIELRQLNESSSENILSYIVEQLAPHVYDFDQDLLDRIMRGGAAVLFLDGYDELYAEAKAKISKQIDRFSYLYPNMKIVVSGRPDERFSSWSEFTELTIAPLSKDRCLSLIKKAKYPEDLRDRFYINVDENLFSSHWEYLQNPLMTYVMLLTSDQFVEFPDDIGAFYNKAFETLFRGHDVMKSGNYQREVNCPIKMKELENVLSYFCAVSFIDECYEYTVESATKYITKALQITSLDIDPVRLIDDLAKNYCMLVLDNGKYNYIHRSFQEYFAALCLSHSELIDYMDYNTSVATKRMEADRYMVLLKDVGPERFETKYFLPTLRDFVAAFYVKRNKQPREIIIPFVTEVGVDETGEIRLIHVGNNRKWVGFERVLSAVDRKKYPRVFGVVLEREEFEHKPVSSRHEIELRMIDLKTLPVAQLKKSSIYRHFKSMIEKAKSDLDELEKKNMRLKKIAN